MGRAGRIVLGLVLAVLAGWGGAATWYAYDRSREADRLAAEQAEQRRAYEDKVRALTRRLVGVASHQMLEADGLEGRMADLITRQDELETRQAAIAALLEQARLPAVLPRANPAEAAPPARTAAPASAAPGPAAPPAPTATPTRTRSVEPAGPVPSLRLGAPGPAQPREPSRPPEPPRPPEPAPRPQSGAPLKERFARIEGSVRRVEAGQVQALQDLQGWSQAQVALVRGILGELGLDPERLDPPIKDAAPRGGLFSSAAPKAAPADPFDAGLLLARRGLAHVDRLRPVTAALPFQRPLPGDDSTTSNFGPRSDPFTGQTAMHSGMDFRGETGTPVQAAGNGRVVVADVAGGYGNMVELDHGHGVTTRYAHLSAFQVAHGQTVTAGQVVGLLGSTGRSTGPHLHYETRINGEAIDPARFLQNGSRLFAAQAPRS